MNLRILQIFVILSLAFPAGLQAQFDSEVFDQLSASNGLSSSVVTCMMKDSKGFMWFGTQNGLNKFDGYRFTIYQYSDTLTHSISGNYILSLFEDSNGTIWVGTENNGVNIYNRQTDRFSNFRSVTEFPESLASGSVRDVIEDNEGTLYFATDHGIFVYIQESNLFQPMQLAEEDSELNNLQVFDLFLDGDESIWIGTSGGLFHYAPGPGTIRVYTHDRNNLQSLSNNSVNTIFRTSRGNLYIGTNSGLNRFSDSLRVFSRYYYNTEDNYSEAKSEVQAMAEDTRGNLWVGSFGGGLVKINEETEKAATFVNNPDQKNSLSNDYVYSLLYDPAGILWIGTYGGGINKIDQVKIRFDHLEALDNTPHSLPSNDVYSILPMNDAILFGMDQGLAIWHREDNTFQSVELFNSTQVQDEPEVYCLLHDDEGYIWVGTAEQGVIKFNPESEEGDPGQLVRFTENTPGPKRIVSDQILCMHYDQEKNTWIGTLNGISIVRNDTVVATFESDPADSTSLADNEVYTIISDRTGNIWIGSFLGLNKFNPADSSFYFYNNLLGNNEAMNSIYCLFQDYEDYLWIGTDNNGLIKFDINTEKVVGHYTKNGTLPDNVIYGIQEDDEHNLWLSSNTGLIKGIRQGSSHNLTFIPFNKSNWLQADAYNIGAFATGQDGFMYFGSFEGVTYFHPENVKGNNYNPPIYITDFQLFFEPVPISDDKSSPLSAHITETRAIKLNYRQNVLRFRFAALNFIQPEKNTYAFWMENLEDQWNYSGSQREAQYMYIPPGEYTFHVKAANNDGVWNEEGVSLKITITPPFTETIWFYLLIIVSVSGIVIWVMNIRTRRLRATRARLERQVQLRTQELRKTNKNLEDEIQERQKVQEALAKSEARFRQLIETMNEGFSVQDKEGRINYINPKLCEMLGMTQDEIVGKFPIDFVDDSSPIYRERFLEQMKRGTRQGLFGSYELNWKRKDGSIFTAMVSPKPIFDSENNYSGNVAVLTDITDLKNAENQLIAKNKDLNEALEDLRLTQAQLIDSEKMASLGQLTAGVAHEINNPINFVSGNVLPLRRDIQDILDVLKTYDQVIERLKLGADFADVVALKNEIDFDFVLSEIDHLLDGIGEGATRTAEIVKGLRNFSRMDEHELKMASINQGIDSTLLILHNKIKNRIKIIKDYGNISDIMCYPGQLNQVFMNLLNNAQESIEEEGSITIKTWQEGNYVKIAVSDTGRGMADSVKKKIFDPFFTTKDVGKGTGLGLSISFGIVEKHKGNIAVRSNKGKGTTFTVSIPNNLS